MEVNEESVGELDPKSSGILAHQERTLEILGPPEYSESGISAKLPASILSKWTGRNDTTS